MVPALGDVQATQIAVAARFVQDWKMVSFIFSRVFFSYNFTLFDYVHMRIMSILSMKKIRNIYLKKHTGVEKK